MAVTSFVDRDMIMRYFGGGVGHLKNTPPQQAHISDLVDPESEEMDVEDEEGNTGGNTRGDLQDITQVMGNGELEVGEEDEEKGQDDSNENEDDSDDIDDEDSDDDDEDKDSESALGDENEDEDYGYGSP
jgi:hypothetical protein